MTGRGSGTGTSPNSKAETGAEATSNEESDGPQRAKTKAQRKKQRQEFIQSLKICDPIEPEAGLPLFSVTVLVMATKTMLIYAVLVYGRGFNYYVSNIADEFSSRDTANYAKCIGEGEFFTSFDMVRGFI